MGRHRVSAKFPPVLKFFPSKQGERACRPALLKKLNKTSLAKTQSISR